MQTHNDNKILILTYLPTKVLNDNMLELSTNRFATYLLHYKKIPGMTKCVYNLLFLQSLLKQSFLLGDLSNCIIKFATYHLQYNNKAVGDLIQTFVYVANYLYFLCYWSNLLAAFFFTHDSNAYIAQPGLITKKREPSRILSLFTRHITMPSYSRLLPLYLSHRF